MNRFIKLTNRVINTSKLVKIENYDNKYSMYFCNNNISGYFIVSIGNLFTSDNTIVICKEKTPVDYQIVEDWIKSIEK